MDGTFMSADGKIDEETARVLLVEDDPEISALMVRFLSGLGYGVDAVSDGRAMEAAIANENIGLVLLDVMLPADSGFDLCRRIRATSNARVIMVTSLADVSYRVAGLDLGADDYISKPFELDELGARIRAVLRRGSGDRSRVEDPELLFAGWRFAPEHRVLYSPRGVRMALTGAETDLMLVFCRNPRQVLTRARLIELTRGEGRAVEERAVDLLVSRLRRKLAQGGRQLELIRTVRGDGYRFDPDLTGRERPIQ